METKRTRITNHAAERYREQVPGASIADIRRALAAGLEVDGDTAFRLSSGNPLHPSHNGPQCRFIVANGGRGMFVLKPASGRSAGRYVVPTYLRLPDDPTRRSILTELGVQ